MHGGAGRQVTDTGVLLETLVADAGFGNHPVLVALTRNGHPIAHGPELVVPGDRLPVRSLARVSQLTVGIATATTGNDNYVAAVPPAEQLAGGRPLQLSLNEDGQAWPSRGWWPTATSRAVATYPAWWTSTSKRPAR